MAYRIEFAESVKGHFKALTTQQRALVLDEVEKQLLHEPLVPTRNRKRLQPNPVAPWELRIGDLRVFYEVVAGESETETQGVVHVLGVGEKRGNRLRIAGREVHL